MQPIALALPPPPPPVSIPPPSLNGEKLYERDAACKTLFNYLFNSFGARITPICDNCFGAGKTSLVWKFRNVLDQISDWKWPEGSDSLRNAIYIHVPFFVVPLKKVDFNDPNQIDELLLKRFWDVFSLSLRIYHMNPNTIDELINIVNSRCGGYKILLHIDDVGAFEGLKDGKNTLYRMWHIGELFRMKGGHFYVLTGRSSYLRTIGKSETRNNPGCFVSPNPASLIPLPLLSSSSVKSILQEHREKLPSDLFNENGDPNEEIINFIHTFTGGVPRAIIAAVTFYFSEKYASLSSMSALEAFVADICPINNLQERDRTILYLCLEFSWAQISMTDNYKIFDEPITAIIARLGIYRSYQRYPTFTLKIPLYLIRGYSWIPRSIMSISENEDKGQRLESGFRRILHLRMSLQSTDSNWENLGLSILQQNNVPFPEVSLHKSYAFPKIKNGNNQTEVEARRCMNEIHNRSLTLSQTEFSSNCLPWLYDAMEIGQYYQPLPMSNSADALIRCSQRDLVCFQFKNLQTPFKKKDLDVEIDKCKVNGWNIYMVLVCTKGHLVDGGVDYFEDMNGVNVILLSKNSVEKFLGVETVLKFSSDSMYEDSSSRQEVIPLVEHTFKDDAQEKKS